MQEAITIEINEKEFHALVDFEWGDLAVTDINFIHIMVEDDYHDVSFLKDVLGEDISEDIEELLS